MTENLWQVALVVTLGLNAVIGFGYRVYRLSKGSPIADVWGQAILGALLAGVAIGVALGVVWLRWAALVYAVLFALLVMPIWVLGVLIPLRPGAIDYAFTTTYWVALVVIGVAALLM